MENKKKVSYRISKNIAERLENIVKIFGLSRTKIVEEGTSKQLDCLEKIYSNSCMVCGSKKVKGKCVNCK